MGSHARPRRTYRVDEPDHEHEGSELDAIEEVDAEWTTESEGAYPEEVYVEQDVEQEEE